MEKRNERSGVEPVGYVSGFYGGYCVIQPTDPSVVLPVGTALYRAPTEWVGLTDAELIRQEEREACAKLCEEEIKRVKPVYSVTAENCVKAIRARGEQ